MGDLYILGDVIAIALLVYLLTVLLNPEKFS